jgi:hypothetical protein
MSRITLLTAAALILAAPSPAEIVDVYLELVFEGDVPGESTPYILSYDLVVCIEGDDAWLGAAGLEVGEAWIHIYGPAEFYQHPAGGDTPPDPALFATFPGLQYDTFYTTHRGWPNTHDQGTSPGFAFGPISEPQRLTADWFWTPDGNFYPGCYTIARVTFLPPADGEWWCVEYAVRVGSVETALTLYHGPTLVGCCYGDIDHDWDVDLDDLAKLLSRYGATSNVTYNDGDLDQDGDIDLNDLVEMLAEYGNECG